MNYLSNENITPPPSIISSLKTGFDITASHISIILFPVLLDIFLWFGPHLRVDTYFSKLLTQYNAFVHEYAVPVAEAQVYQEMMNGLISLDINLFSFLRTFPIGVSSLMRQAFPSQTPLGEPTFYQINSAFTFSLWAIGLTLIGWFMGSLYFAWVAKTSLQDEEQNFVWAIKVTLQATLLALIWTIIFFAFGTPLLLIFLVFAQINASLAQFALIFLALFAMWIIVPVFFSTHGIYTKGENLFRSMLSSFHLARFTLPISSFFIISVVILSLGFDILWLTPSSSSWMLLVGILGHAFITTSLLAASFIYYRNMNIWLEALLEILDSKKTTSAQA